MSLTLPWTLGVEKSGTPVYSYNYPGVVREPPRIWPVRSWFGYDDLGRSLFARALLGGTISLAVGVAAALISMVLGVTVGLFAGYRGGWVDSVLMRIVDILYGLPYILLIILFKIALEPTALRLRWTAPRLSWPVSWHPAASTRPQADRRQVHQ